MGRNVFVTYKYKDDKVAPLLINTILGERTIVRHYVDQLQKKLADDDHINLGERDGESLAEFADPYIETALKYKIFGSSITIVLISKGMKDLFLNERDQWIPWEVSYSLREVTRADRTSRMNAILGIVLPDENNSYEWYYTENLQCNCTTHNTPQLFNILRSNMFNMRSPLASTCNGLTIHHGEFSFIKTVKWEQFGNNSNYYLDKAIEIRDNRSEYEIKVNLD
jgi:hypothetical protein